MATFAQDTGVSVLRLNGESAAQPAARLRSDLARAVARSSPIVVDLTDAPSIDATIVAILLDGLAESEKHEHVFLLLLPDDAASPVHRLFRRTGLAELLPVVGSWDEALRRARAVQPAPGCTSPFS